MNDSKDLELHPYHGEGVASDFQYAEKHRTIIDFFNNDAKEPLKNSKFAPV